MCFVLPIKNDNEDEFMTPIGPGLANDIVKEGEIEENKLESKQDKKKHIKSIKPFKKKMLDKK